MRSRILPQPIVAVLLVLTGCASAPSLSVIETAASGDLPPEYVFSIYDAAVFEQDEVQPLPSITSDSLTVVSWVNSTFASSYPPGVDTTYAFEMWVTIAPQVQDACRGFDQDPPSLRNRLQQYLGLKPEPSKERFFVTLTVARADMFRACTDPSLETTSCSESVPAGVSDAHTAWVAKQMLSSYVVSTTADGTGYPWTRMGYTYDWNPGTPEVGAYEYVIPPGSPVRIVAATPTGPYCTPSTR